MNQEAQRSVKPVMSVVVGIVFNAEGRVLMAQRPAGKSWAGYWEFPGGKIEVGERPEQALCRELDEELGLQVQASDVTPWLSLQHEYEHHAVSLQFFQVRRWSGVPEGREQQAFAWVDCQQPPSPLIPSAQQPCRYLQLPDRYAVTMLESPEQAQDYLPQLAQQLASGLRLVQFRAPQWQGSATQLRTCFAEVLAMCRAQGAYLLVNSIHPKAWWAEADGVQLRAQDAIYCETRPLPNDKWVGVSCHHLADVLYANRLGADLLLIGHVAPTPSHADQAPLGWAQFAELAQQSSCPAFAIGGQSLQTLAQAQTQGAHGVAYCRALMP